MQSISYIVDFIDNNRLDEQYKKLYVTEEFVAYNRERYKKALKSFQDIYGDKEVAIFSAPGRTEVCGNHTDHQLGCVLAASINLDAIAIVSPVDSNVIRLVSDEQDMLEVNLDNLSVVEREVGTTNALIRGVASGLVNKGYKIGGFDAYVTSDVLIGAGMSSSAAFESLIGACISGLYNDGNISSVDIAKVGQYAENEYFGKPCGLMDQMASSVGGLIYIDFENTDPIIQKVPCELDANGYSLCIVDTKGSHADLTDDYAAIPKEMKQVASFFGKDVLRQVDEKEFIQAIPSLRKHFNDRSVLRTMHFFGEQARVRNCVSGLNNGDFDGFLTEINNSGASSFKLLQNIYSAKDVFSQNVNVALSYSEYILKDNGVCRVHGGGFAGTIQAFVKKDYANEYKAEIEKIFGDGSCRILSIRDIGQTEINL